MYFTTRKDKVQGFEDIIHFDGRDLNVKAAIIPARHAPHVSADSPRHMEPGAPARVVWYALFDDEGRDITVDYCFDADDRAITRLILDAWVMDCVADRLAEVV